MPIKFSPPKIFPPPVTSMILTHLMPDSLSSTPMNCALLIKCFAVLLSQRIPDPHQMLPWRECLPGAPGIRINVLVIDPNALPPSYRAWGALFTIAKAQVSHA